MLVEMTDPRRPAAATAHAHESAKFFRLDGCSRFARGEDPALVRASTGTASGHLAPSPFPALHDIEADYRLDSASYRHQPGLNPAAKQRDPLSFSISSSSARFNA